MDIKKLDTGVTAIEIDPNKEYMFIVDHDALTSPGQIRFQNGYIIYKKPGSEIQIIEKEKK